MALDTKNLQYNGITLSTTDIEKGDNGDVILSKIDSAINDHNTAPNYSGYNLYCVKQVDGVTHPTNTQNFAEGISKNLCDFHSDYNTFTGTTYPTEIASLSSAISALQTPNLTYSVTAGGGSIIITNGMTRNQVLTATYTGVGDILTLLNTPGNTWGTLSITTPHNINTAFNDLISYLSSLTTTVGTKQASIGTFDATPIGGGATDSITTTVNELITYSTSLPTLNLSGFVWGAVSTGTTLTNSLQNTVNAVTSIITDAVVAQGTGLTIASVGSIYQGKKLAVDPTYTQLYKVMVTGDAYTNAGVLDSKIKSSDSSITMSVSGNQLDLTVTTPADNKVKVNASDATAGYLSTKIQSTSDAAWGLALNSVASDDNSQLILTPTLGNPKLHLQAEMSYIASDPDLLLQFANLIATSQNVPGPGVTDLLVTLTAGNFVYTWTAESGVSQQAKWRPRGNVMWNTALLSPANPLSAVAVTTTLSPAPINVPIQCQVDTIYSTGLVGSNIYEIIDYQCQSDTHSHTGGVISISQVGMLGIEIIEYRLILNAGSVLQETIIASGLAPGVTFSSVSAGTYHVEWRYGTTINGSILYSDDASQLNAMCTSSNIVIV